MVRGLERLHQLVGEHVAEKNAPVDGSALAGSVGCRAEFFLSDDPDPFERVSVEDIPQRVVFRELQ